MNPHLHVSPQHGWLNDPHGITFRDGVYHVFYQYLPNSSQWRPQIEWGHATSADLITWTEHPVALTPAVDETGCWTGCLQVDPSTGEARILYTSVREPNLDLGQVRAAVPLDPDWITWRPSEVVVRAPEELGLKIFRDPSISASTGGYRMVVGAGFRDGSPAVLSFLSPDGLAWDYEGVLAKAAPDASAGFAWECPQLLHVGGLDVLIVSACHTSGDNQVLGSVGVVRNGRWEGSPWRQLTFGTGHYAATAFTDADGEPCVMFWIRGISDPDGQWVGTLSVPYRVEVFQEQLRLVPHPAVADAFVSASQGALPNGLAAPEREWLILRDGPVVEWCSGTEVVGAQSAAGEDYSSSGR